MTTPRPPLVIRLIPAVTAVLVLTGACGDQPLGRVGDVSERVVHGGTTTTVIAPEPLENLGPQPTVKAAVEVLWLNDYLTVQPSPDPRAVLDSVWDRGRTVSSGFVQAGRQEIVAVLPEVGFPNALPASAEHVTSQLVFDTSSGLLSIGTSAAFGLWSQEPYSVSRNSGQVAVLRVGQNVDPTVTDDDIISEEVEEGINLRWQHRGYTYELFCRSTSVDDVTCWEVAGSIRPLRQLS